jgi:hypothetical protein
LDLLDGLAQQTGSTARHVSVHIHGDDELRGLTDRVASAQHLIDGLAAPSEALPLSQRERGRAEVARLKKELTKASVVLEKATKVERELTTESGCFPSGLRRVTWRLSSGKLRSSSVTVR